MESVQVFAAQDGVFGRKAVDMVADCVAVEVQGHQFLDEILGEALEDLRVISGIGGSRTGRDALIFGDFHDFSMMFGTMNLGKLLQTWDPTRWGKFKHFLNFQKSVCTK